MSQFSESEWDRICMRCGKCCLEKVRVDNKVVFLNRACDKLNLRTAQCKCYHDRFKKKTGCVKASLELLAKAPETWPDACAYRLLYETKMLPWYHHLVCGSKELIHILKQTVAEIPVVVSDGFVDSFSELCDKAKTEKWSDEVFRSKLTALFESYGVAAVMQCEIKTKNG